VIARRPGGVWSAVLLVLATIAGAALLSVWVRGEGSSVPDTVGLDRQQVVKPGVERAVSAIGAGGSLGAVLLGLTAALVVLAMSRVGPRYRAQWAAYLTIACSLAAVAAVVWFLRDPVRQEAALRASSVQLRGDSIQLSWWPWVALVCFSASAVVGVLLVPAATPAAGRRARRARREAE
jgi:hypothetical protein